MLIQDEYEEYKLDGIWELETMEVESFDEAKTQEQKISTKSMKTNISHTMMMKNAVQPNAHGKKSLKNCPQTTVSQKVEL